MLQDRVHAAPGAGFTDRLARSAALLACALVLVACSTTSTVHQAPAPTAGQVYAYEFTHQDSNELMDVAVLARIIRDKLRDAGLLATSEGQGAGTIEVELTHLYVRSDAARFLAGILAGRDRIASAVRVVGRDGTQLGSFEVETTNLTAMGSSDGLMQEHADEIVERLR